MRKIIRQPPDTVTSKQWAEKTGCSYSMAKSRLLRLAELGKVEEVGRGACGVIYYRLKK
jgi:ribosomal protein S25